MLLFCLSIVNGVFILSRKFSSIKVDTNSNSKNFGLLDAVAWICALVAFSPAFFWLVEALAQSQQLRDAIVILVTALAVLAIEYKIRPHKPLFSAASAAWLFGAYACLFSSKFFGIWGVFLALAGFSAAFVSIGLACFDKRRYVYAAGGAFYAFTILSFFIRAFDLPLRVLAGKLSAWILSMFNDSVALMAYGGDAVRIGLQVDGKSYLVATECNGFGIISGCVILSIICAIFRKNISVLKRAGIVALCAALAYIFNSFRIVAIICLAPVVGSGNYHLMHETAGYIFFALALLSVWHIGRKI